MIDSQGRADVSIAPDRVGALGPTWEAKDGTPQRESKSA